MTTTPAIYALADEETFGAERLPEVVAALAEAGVGYIQLRMKRAPGALAYRLTEASFRRLEGSDSALWIDDRADLARLFPVFGVHVGQDDLPPSAVRRIVGSRRRIGRSTHDLEQLRVADADPDIDLVAFGPVFATSSKRGADPVVGLDGLSRARAATEKPLVAIGGINATNLRAVLDAGADSVAMIRAFGTSASSYGEIRTAARELLATAASGEVS